MCSGEMLDIEYNEVSYLWFDIDEEEDEEPFVDYSDESGFDPYMGCYTGGC